MATEHTFTTIGGETKTATLTPIRAIREHCVSPYGVAECGGDRCPLHPFRMGDAHSIPAEQRAVRSANAKMRAGR